ncbi:unnamed protein product [Didymodactylos carnosus]|uniref:Uncharacterized protein n=1 Tax=Didymodactylos carnosus TaxID=1234261 RepID=A0A8S2I0D1_9BILA|nr:unnamed protein product [Didymodactylos carnosus]CAF3702946.1 unnamed protein product [Didymodactylos carnosus]
MSDDGNDSKMEDKSTTGKIEAMSKEELLKLIKLQLLQNKKNQTKTNELTTANTVLCQKQEVLLNELDNERVKYTKLVEEVDQLKKIEITTQSELTILREQLDLLQSQNETLTSTCKTFQEKNSNLQNEVLSVRSSPTIEQQELSTKLIDSQRDIENLNNLKLQLEQTIEQLNIKLKKADQLFQKYILSTVDLLDIFHDNSGNKMELIREPNNVDIFNLYSSELKRIRQTDILYTDLKQSYEQLYMERQQLQQQYDDLKPMSLEQRIEDLEFFNEELKSELMTIKDDYRMKMNAYGQREQEYRRQIEDFEEQFNSLQQEQLQQREQQMIASPSEESRSFSTSSDVLRLESTSSSTINHSDVSDIVHDTLQFIVNFVDLSEKNNSTTNNNNNNNNTSLQSSTLSSSTSSLLLSCDISTLLHSIGITNFTEELYLSNYADVLRLCTLLIERCRVLQYALLRRSHSSDMFSASLESLSIDDQLKSSSLSLFEDSSSSLIDCSSTTKSGYQEYCAIIHRHHNKSLDSIFDLLLDWTTSSTIDTRSLNENWKITISRPNSQNEKSQIRFELSTDAITLSLMPEQYYNGLDALTSETKKLIVENEQQKDEIKLLEKRLSHNESYEHLKTRQTLLEEQLDKQCAQTIELENILKDEFGNKSKYEQIQLSYDELETKYLIAEQLNEQLKTLKEKYDDLVSHLTEKDEQLAKNRCYLIERDEQIKLLTIELQQERSNTVELKQSANELNTLKSEYKEIKQLKANVEHELEQLKDDLNDKDKNKAEEIKQQQFSTDLLEKKKLECNQLIEKVNHYVTDLENVNKSLFEKTKLANELDERLQTMNINYENYKMKYEQTIHEQQKLLDDLNISQNGKQLLIEKIHNYEMKQNNMQDKQTDTNEFKQQEVQLQQAYDEIKQKLQITDEEYLQIVKQAKNEIEQLLLKNNEINEKLSKLEENRLVMETEYRQSIKQITNENIVLQETVENLTKKLNHEVTTPPPPSETSTGENIQELKEKYHKMKLLLTRLKKELQEKNQQPKQSLIDLELADYEKTIKYLKEEIQKKDKEISDFHEELNVRDDKYNGIKSERKYSVQLK